MSHEFMYIRGLRIAPQSPVKNTHNLGLIVRSKIGHNCYVRSLDGRRPSIWICNESECTISGYHAAPEKYRRTFVLTEVNVHSIKKINDGVPNSILESIGTSKFNLHKPCYILGTVLMGMFRWMAVSRGTNLVDSAPSIKESTFLFSTVQTEVLHRNITHSHAIHCIRPLL